MEAYAKRSSAATASLYNGQPTDTGSSCPSTGLASSTPSTSKLKGGVSVENVNLLTAFAVTVSRGTSQTANGYQSGTSQATNGYQSGTSQNCEYRPFGQNILTLQERILEFCSEPKSLREIADFLGAANKKKVKAKYIDGILGTKIVMTIPDKPNSRLQKYVTVK